MLLCQVGYWYLGSPGPTLLQQAPKTLAAAVHNIFWALIFLWLIPTLVLRLGGKLKSVPLGLGDWPRGLQLCLPLIAIATLVLSVAAGDAGLQRTYPWSGAYPAASPWHFTLWALLYSLYYLSFEFFYRGFVLSILAEPLGWRGANWAQVMFSTLIHLGKPLSETLAAFPAGFLFAWLRLKTNSLWWPIFLHVAIGLLTDFFILQRSGAF